VTKHLLNLTFKLCLIALKHTMKAQFWHKLSFGTNLWLVLWC